MYYSPWYSWGDPLFITSDPGIFYIFLVSDEEIDILLRAADRNGDKRIDLHEFG